MFFKSAICGWTSDLEGSYSADPVVRYSWVVSGSSWVYLALPKFIKPDSFQKHHGFVQLSARRLLVLRHGPSARLQGVANVAGYEPPVQRSAYGRCDPRFDFCRRDPRFCWTLLRDGLDCLHFTESPGNGHSRPGRWHSFSSPTHALALRASWTVHCTHIQRP